MFNCPLLSPLCIHCQDLGSKMYWENMNTSNRLPKYRHRSLCAGHPIRCTLDRNHEPSSWRSQIHLNSELHSSFSSLVSSIVGPVENNANDHVQVKKLMIKEPKIELLTSNPTPPILVVVVSL